MQFRKLVTTLILLDLYRKGLISNAAQGPFLSQLLRFCSTERDNDTKELPIKVWLERYTSAIIGRSVFDLFLARLWELTSIEFLFVFLESHRNALETRRGLRTSSLSRRDLRFSSRSPFGIVIRRGLHTLSSVKFAEIATLCATIIHFRESLTQLCRHAQVSRITSSLMGSAGNSWLAQRVCSVSGVRAWTGQAKRQPTTGTGRSSVARPSLSRVMCSGNYNGAVEACMVQGVNPFLCSLDRGNASLSLGWCHYHAQMLVDTYFACASSARFLLQESISAMHANVLEIVPQTAQFEHLHSSSLRRGWNSSVRDITSGSVGLKLETCSLPDSCSGFRRIAHCLRCYLFSRYCLSNSYSTRRTRIGRVRLHQQTSFRLSHFSRAFENFESFNQLYVASCSRPILVYFDPTKLSKYRLLGSSLLLTLLRIGSGSGSGRCLANDNVTYSLIVLTLILNHHGEFEASLEILEGIMPVLLENSDHALHGAIFSQIADCLLGACRGRKSKRSGINKCMDMLDRSAHAFAQAGNIRARLEILSKKARLLHYVRERDVRNRTLQMWRHINASFNSRMPLPSSWI
ncbi:hypothetical protein BJ508DRAFT_106886 [Ascobolus immersus RN42]|uniref:Anaphase-promoting complex subunit 5 n=1 Tax=Ascobolus immersus RN42 TaxID=1160509 RepID=A0A3N4IAY3_ASCIM|nr:hypothetical protein BJ508DRAFT_106886 [Ascobolus immersus RN42]